MTVYSVVNGGKRGEGKEVLFSGARTSSSKHIRQLEH